MATNGEWDVVSEESWGVVAEEPTQPIVAPSVTQLTPQERLQQAQAALGLTIPQQQAMLGGLQTGFGQAGRALIQGPARFAGMLADPLLGTQTAAAGEQIANFLGLPQYAPEQQKFIAPAAEALGSTLLTAGLGGSMAAVPTVARTLPTASNIPQAIGTALATRPVAQAGAALGGTAGGIYTPELIPDLGPTGRTVASLLGTLAGGLAGGMGAGRFDVRTPPGMRPMEITKQTETVKQQSIQQLNLWGYKVPPSVAGTAGTGKGILREGIAGKYATNQQFAEYNQKIINRDVINDFKVPELGINVSPKEELSMAFLKGIRKQAGDVYKQIKDVKRIYVDPEYVPSKISPQVKETSAFAGAQRQYFNADDTVETIKQLRADGHGLSKPGAQYDPAKIAEGRRLLLEADQLEDLLKRNLINYGKPELANNIDIARRTIAKTHAVENALVEATGDVDAKYLLNMFNDREPLSGGMLRAAQAAQMLGPAAKYTNRTIADMSPVDAGVTTIAATQAISQGSIPGIISSLSSMARAPLRRQLMTEEFQNLMIPTYQQQPLTPSLLAPTAAGIAEGRR